MHVLLGSLGQLANNDAGSTPTERATPENLTPDIDNIIGAIETAIDNVEKLQGKPDNIILASADGSTTLTPDDIGDLLDFIVKVRIPPRTAVWTL